MNKKHLTLCLSLFLISSCHQRNDKYDETRDTLQTKLADSLIIEKKSTSTPNHKDDAEQWLHSIFKTEKSDKYFPSPDVEEKLCTERFQEFIAESGEIYGPSNLTDDEYPAAEERYKEKWSKIYPIEEREMWLFGRGNGDIGELEQLKISKIKDQIYNVFIDYGNGIKTRNEVTLVSENGDFKIDYCKTEFL